jgi:DNA recombination protein RmuC
MRLSFADMDYSTPEQALNSVSATPDVASILIGLAIGLLAGLLLTLWQVMRSRGQQLPSQERERYQRETIDRLTEELRLTNEKLQKAQENEVRAQTEKAASLKQMELQREDFKKMEMQFENLANRIFDEKSTKFKTQSTESLNELLSPLRERLNDFQKKVDDSFGKHAMEQSTLKEHIRMIVETHEKHQIQTESLTRALKGDTKKQGDWGEIMLEKILESSGLRKGEDYTLQAGGMGLKHVETGGTIKPDAIVNLPEGKHIVIDSKVSLTHYERFCADDGNAAEEAQAHLSQFLKSVRQHVKDLEKRRYQDTDRLGTPDFVVMFLPVEGAYMLALQKDSDLHQFAWDKGVVLVGPSTLFSTLRTVASLWRLVNQNTNAQEIAKQGGLLYEKIVGFVNDMDTIGKGIDKVQDSYGKAMRKLSQGPGNILKKTEDMKALGIKTSKSLPAEYVDTEESGLISHDDSDNEKAA